MKKSVVFLLAASTLGGCYYERDRYDDPPTPIGPPPAEEIFESQIDVGETLTTTPGEGAGVFVEYSGGGQWRVFTACDSKLSGYACEWDVLVTAPFGVALSNVQDEGLEGDDVVYISEADSEGRTGEAVNLVSYTSTGTDGVTFQSDPGEPIRIDVILDGVSEPRYTYWIGDGAIHRGAPSNPMDLVPGPE